MQSDSINRASAAIAAIGAIALASAVTAAPTAFQTAVLAHNPYAYYRQQETGITTGATATDLSGNNRHASYIGSPAGGQDGAGLLSDAAVRYSGAATGAATQYFGSEAIRSLGASLGTSSFEFVFKTNPGLPTQKQSLFGVFNNGATTGVEVTLNSQGNDAFADTPNTTRFFIRGDDGDAVGVHFTNAVLYDGNYHHLVFTFNASQSGVSAFAAYLDGVAQELTFQQVGTGGADPDTDPDSFSAFAFDPTFAARNVRTTLGGAAITRQANITLDEAVLYSSVLTPEQVAAHAAAIPEPASLALVGLAGLGLLARRRGA